MKKNWYTSKTLWGFGLLFVISFLQQQGWLSEALIPEIIKLIATLTGVYGARDALK